MTDPHYAVDLEALGNRIGHFEVVKLFAEDILQEVEQVPTVDDLLAAIERPTGDRWRLAWVQGSGHPYFDPYKIVPVEAQR